jgi:hypothetical protein
MLGLAERNQSKWTVMTEAISRTERYAEGEFRVGGVLNRTWSVLAKNFPAFFAVTAVASLPDLVLANPGQNRALLIASAVVSTVMLSLSQATVVYGAFQQMSGKPVRLLESLRTGWHRFPAVIGLAICSFILMALGAALLIIPGLIVATMLFVATPVCVVERLGPFDSMERSAQLTKGHRWKIFGMLVLLAVPAAIVGALIDTMAEVVGVNEVLGSIAHVAWDATWGAAYAVLVIAIYHDLRVAKEGVDTAQIAAVFE